MSATIARAFDVGMDAVGLVQRRLAGHPVEQERQERHVVLAGDIAIDLPEDPVYSGPKFGGASMPTSSTAMRLSLRALDDRRPGSSSSRSTGSPRRPSLRAELDDQHPDVALLERPVQPLAVPPADVSPETPALTTSQA